MLGDLGFFYDMNSLGNRHIGPNVRILLVNNGVGTEFKNYLHTAAIHGDDTDRFIAAAGHFGNKSESLVRHFAEDLGFRYLCATNKEEFIGAIDEFTNDKITDMPLLLEVFTDSKDESEALKAVRNLKAGIIPNKSNIKKSVRRIATKTFGEKRLKALRTFIKG